MNPNSISIDELITVPVVRSVPFEITRKASGDGLTLEGYAAVFNETIRIDNPYEGFFDEVIAQGAFDKSINDKAQWPLMMFEHGRHPVVGNLPIGVITQMRADKRGLFVRGRLIDNWITAPVRDAIAAGAINGMSFRAEPILNRVDTSTEPPLVTRLELRVEELGPVVEPAYVTTAVTVRSRAIADALTDVQARGDLALALLATDLNNGDTPIQRNEPTVPSEGHTEIVDKSADAASVSVDTGTDAPPTSGHTSISDARMRAQLALINSNIDVAERKYLHVHRDGGGDG